MMRSMQDNSLTEAHLLDMAGMGIKQEGVHWTMGTPVLGAEIDAFLHYPKRRHFDGAYSMEIHLVEEYRPWENLIRRIQNVQS